MQKQFEVVIAKQKVKPERKAFPLLNGNAARQRCHKTEQTNHVRNERDSHQRLHKKEFMPRIEVIEHSEATGKLKEIYDGLAKRRGKLADVHKIQSLRPKSITAHMDLYMEIMYSRSELSRAERELIGTIVSITNGCKYCTKHHAEALNFYWKDDAKIEKLISEDYTKILSRKELALGEFSKHLTKHPEKHDSEDFTPKLRELGLSDAAILDAVLVTAYFNFVNRIVLSLGVQLEDDKGAGYKY